MDRERVENISRPYPPSKFVQPVTYSGPSEWATLTYILLEGRGRLTRSVNAEWQVLART